ncbi:dialkylrecorsinol condensing enzyme DarA [Mangrovimonas cancribranchiae]|uniref:Dialkylresorcinol condensing enzyme DarA n=1 Tax=Mangrovimonas cancribranchiae TaxID=3080055 RepID=A0AAU6NXJ2_9FLAO
MKRILVLHYSQSGQLTEIVKNIASSFESNEDLTVDYHNITLTNPFPFPWPKKAFFEAFPETYKQIPVQVEPVPQTILNNNYDLIVFGYQVWYLTPSLPITSFLETNDAKKLFKDTPVVTVLGCRNMWIMAQEKMKKRLIDLKANLVGNIALVDRHINHVSVITIGPWMFTGEKKRYLGIFPKPGVSQKDINESKKFGPIITKHLLFNTLDTLQQYLLKHDAVTIKPFLITTDRKANVIFSKWSQFIISKSKKNTPKRSRLVKMFKYYLLFAIWVIAPIVFILFLLTYLPLYNKIKKDKAYYSSVAYK